MNEDDVIIGRIIFIDGFYVGGSPYNWFIILKSVPSDSIPGLHNISVISLINGHRILVSFYNIRNLIKWE